MDQRIQKYPCACSFAKSVNEKDPTAFPRIGVSENVLRHGYYVIEHKPTGKQAVISRPGAGPWHPEADECCFDWFEGGEEARAALSDKGGV